jgi:hypothetical protein
MVFHARDDDVITSAGYRIGPVEIEQALASHPDVVMAAVVGEPDPVRTEIVVAHVVLRDGRGLGRAARGVAGPRAREGLGPLRAAPGDPCRKPADDGHGQDPAPGPARDDVRGPENAPPRPYGCARTSYFSTDRRMERTIIQTARTVGSTTSAVRKVLDMPNGSASGPSQVDHQVHRVIADRDHRQPLDRLLQRSCRSARRSIDASSAWFCAERSTSTRVLSRSPARIARSVIA